MKVFIGYECSGVFRRLFQAAGCHVISCDLKPAEDFAGNPSATNSGHVTGDVFRTLEWLKQLGWQPDLGVYHPDCTYLTSAAEWSYADPDYVRYPGKGWHQRPIEGSIRGGERRSMREASLLEFGALLRLTHSKVIENPVGVVSTRLRKPTQVIQPYMFGDDASKATCLWMAGPGGEEDQRLIIPIDESLRCPGRLVSLANGQVVERWANQTDHGQNRLSPGANRASDRARTYEGWAKAAVPHWLGILR